MCEGPSPTPPHPHTLGERPDIPLHAPGTGCILISPEFPAFCCFASCVPPLPPSPHSRPTHEPGRANPPGIERGRRPGAGFPGGPGEPQSLGRQENCQDSGFT